MPETNATPEREIVLEEPGFVYPDGPLPFTMMMEPSIPPVLIRTETRRGYGSISATNRGSRVNEVFENGVKVSEESFE